MGDLIKDTDKKNLGGNYSRIIGIELHDGFSRSDIINGVVESFDVQISVLNSMYSDFLFDIEGTNESISVNTNKIKESQGILYETEIRCVIPKHRIDLRNALESLDSKQFVLIVTDNNGNKTLIGDIDNSVIFKDTVDSGEKVSELNSVQISFSWKSKDRIVFLKDNYVINIIADKWILRTSYWGDLGEWVDEASWIDYL